MKTTRWSSLLLAGVLSTTTGCQYEEAGAAPVSAPAARQDALSGPVGRWTRNTSSSVPNSDYSATVLASGEVLVSGYWHRWELYNPYSDTWRTLPNVSPLGPEGGYSATLLPSGLVLLAGGDNADPTQYYENWDNRAYLYDPAANTFTPTGKMTTRRSQHLALLLESGKVLALGGLSFYGDPHITSSAELYDPQTGTWRAVGYDPRIRIDQTATELYSGKVLVAGGFFPYSSPTVMPSATLFDPATGTWTTTGSMSRGRRGHQAVRLYSGQVMVLGGVDGADTSVELYDPYTEQWSAGPSLPISGPYTTATLLYSGEVLVTSEQGKAALYSPGTHEWLPAPDMSGPRRGDPKALRLHTGQVLITGGVRPGTPYDQYTSDIERFTP